MGINIHFFYYNNKIFVFLHLDFSRARWWEILAKIPSDKPDNLAEGQPTGDKYGSHNLCFTLAVRTVVLHSLP